MNFILSVGTDGKSYKNEKVVELQMEPSIQTITAIVNLFKDALQEYLHDHCHAEILGVDPIREEETVI